MDGTRTPPTRIIVEEDGHDPEALRTMLRCLSERPPRITLDKVGTSDAPTWICQMEWAGTDSPRQVACLRISSLFGMPFAGLPLDQKIRECIRMIELAIADETTQSELDEWHGDLKAIAGHAASGHEEWEGSLPSITDYCWASAASPWSRAGAWRSPHDRKAGSIVTLDEAGMSKMLPDLPVIALVRKASLSKKGSAKVNVTNLNGAGTFRNRSVSTLLRDTAQFGEYVPGD